MGDNVKRSSGRTPVQSCRGSSCGRVSDDPVLKQLGELEARIRLVMAVRRRQLADERAASRFDRGGG